MDKLKGGKGMNCQLCNKRMSKRKITVIKNRINGNELMICERCVKEFGFKSDIPESGCKKPIYESE